MTAPATPPGAKAKGGGKGLAGWAKGHMLILAGGGAAVGLALYKKSKAGAAAAPATPAATTAAGTAPTSTFDGTGSDLASMIGDQFATLEGQIGALQPVAGQTPTTPTPNPTQTQTPTQTAAPPAPTVQGPVPITLGPAGSTVPVFSGTGAPTQVAAYLPSGGLDLSGIGQSVLSQGGSAVVTTPSGAKFGVTSTMSPAGPVNDFTYMP